ncbi:hypothetical protein BI292_08300 [Pseudomonas sp. 43NM1]|nr:hypothetical protein BI292_08300 [Pseudomonas sp. 43NM1]
MESLRCRLKVCSAQEAPNLPHWASDGSEGVRSSKGLDRSVKRWLNRAYATGREGNSDRGFIWAKKLRELRSVPTRHDALSAFGGWDGRIIVWPRCKISEQVWSPDAIAQICAIIRGADFLVFVVRCNGGCVLDASGRTDLMVSVDQACTQPPPIVWSRCQRFPKPIIE